MQIPIQCIRQGTRVVSGVLLQTMASLTLTLTSHNPNSHPNPDDFILAPLKVHVGPT